MKILFTLNDEIREGYESRSPYYLSEIPTESVEEIVADNLIEKLSGLVEFLDECYRILQFGGTVKINSPYYSSIRAWSSPLTVRGLAEQSLNFSCKKWREENKYSEATVKADFEVTVQFLLETSVMQRNEAVRVFWINKYTNVVQAILFTLTKKSLDEKK